MVCSTKVASMSPSRHHKVDLLVPTYSRRRWGLGRCWLVVIPLLTFVLCQLCHLRMVTPRWRSVAGAGEGPPFYFNAELTRLFLRANNLSELTEDPAHHHTPTSPYEWERAVTERYLRVQLALVLSSGSLSLAPGGPPLARLGGTLGELRTFQPLLTPREKGQLLHLFQLFGEACRRHDLTYFLLGRSLLGSLRHHGVIPWSDVSVTVAMNWEQRGEVRAVLDGVEGTSLLWSQPDRWSLRLSDWAPDPPTSSRMTFLVVQFFRQNSTHVWVDSFGGRTVFTAPLDSVFPLALRPFEGLWTPVPCDVTSVLTSYRARQCRVLGEDEAEGEFYDAGVIPCDVMARAFPFVTRRLPMTTHSVLEQVTVNGTMVSSVLLDSPACQDGAATALYPAAELTTEPSGGSGTDSDQSRSPVARLMAQNISAANWLVAKASIAFQSSAELKTANSKQPRENVQSSISDQSITKSSTTDQQLTDNLSPRNTNEHNTNNLPLSELITQRHTTTTRPKPVQHENQT